MRAFLFREPCSSNRISVWISFPRSKERLRSPKPVSQITTPHERVVHPYRPTLRQRPRVFTCSHRPAHAGQPPLGRSESSRVQSVGDLGRPRHTRHNPSCPILRFFSGSKRLVFIPEDNRPRRSRRTGVVAKIAACLLAVVCAISATQWKYSVCSPVRRRCRPSLWL